MSLKDVKSTGIEVVVTDLETGERDRVLIGDGPEGYVVTCGPGCYVAHSQTFQNGTTQLTIKPQGGADV